MPYIGIETRYLGPTDTKGARVVATSSLSRRMVIPWDYARNARLNHVLASRVLLHDAHNLNLPPERLATVEWPDRYTHTVEVP